jgi:hypothetical protein
MKKKTLQNTFVQKTACKMLVKLTPGANFIDILWALLDPIRVKKD